MIHNLCIIPICMLKMMFYLCVGITLVAFVSQLFVVSKTTWPFTYGLLIILSAIYELDLWSKQNMIKYQVVTHSLLVCQCHTACCLSRWEAFKGQVAWGQCCARGQTWTSTSNSAALLKERPFRTSAARSLNSSWFTPSKCYCRTWMSGKCCLGWVSFGGHRTSVSFV